MSLILEALRKMEQERKSRKGAATGIRAEVLRYRAAAQQPQARPYLVVGVVVGLVLAGVGAGFLLKGGREPQATAAPQAGGTYGGDRMEKNAPVPVVAPVPVPASAPSAPAASPVAMEVAAQPQPAAQASPVRPEAPVAAPAPPQSAAPRAAKAAPNAAVQSKAARQEAAARPQSQAPPRESAPEAVAVLPDITISGIAYQDERSLRRAVLNGALVGEGAEVAGARVVEIKENKVRMSRGGQHFEVLFSSGLNSR